MSEISRERRLFREAADLAIRLQNDPANPVCLDMVRAWVARGPDHAEAWKRVADIHGMAGKLFADERRGPAKGAVSRRGVLVGAVIGLGTAATGAWVAPSLLLRSRADHVTATAEIRRLDLSDGSILTLGPDSAVAVAFSDMRRSVELLMGMVYCEIAADDVRLFSVSSGPLSATAGNATFDMSNEAGLVSLSVETESVDASVKDDPRHGSGERVAAGASLTLDLASGDIFRAMRDASSVGAWRQGTIVAENESVSAVVAKIARWLPGRVVLADPFLGERRVSGVFDLGKPATALEAAVSPFGARVRQLGGYLTVISPV